MDDAKKTAASLALVLTLPAGASAATETAEQAMSDMLIEPAPGGGDGSAALAAFASDAGRAPTLRFSPEPDITGAAFSFQTMQPKDAGEVGVIIEDGALVAFNKTDVVNLPDTFLTPVDPMAPSPLVNGAQSLEAPLPGAAPLLLAGLAAFGFASARGRK